jgi:hypothetical protein
LVKVCIGNIKKSPKSDGQKNKAHLTLPRDQARGEKGLTMRLIYTIYPSGYVTVELKE